MIKKGVFTIISIILILSFLLFYISCKPKEKEEKIEISREEEIGLFGKYGTPIEEPIGNMFIPFGGVKPVDENAVQNIEDLQDIPEARAQSQTTGKLIANSTSPTALT